jgi:hypothetical protein
MRALVVPLLAAACAGAPEAPGWRPDRVCPGDPDCPTADGPLRVGAARRSILPTCWEAWDDNDGSHTWSASRDTLYDCGCDRLCPDDPGYPGADRGEGDGVLQTVWMAGFQNGRAMRGVRGAELGLVGDGDGIDARAIVLERGETRIALVTVDVIGLFYEPEVTAIRDAVAARGLDVDHVVVHAAHNHEGPDTMGNWGAAFLRRGVVDAYQAELIEASADAVGDAVAALRPVARLRVGEGDIGAWHPERGSRNLVNDTRDPYIVDSRVGVAHFEGEGGETLATLVSWANHPETMGSSNNLLTADFVHALRVGVERGVTWRSRSAEGLGGTAIFINGALGGMMTPLRIDVQDPDGAIHASGTWEKADTIGLIVAEVALDALDRADVAADPDLAARSHRYEIPVDNIGFQAMFLAGVLTRPLTRYDDTVPIDATNRPHVRTEASVVEIGPLQLATVPGELLPEALLGGYDGGLLDAPVPLVRPDNPFPPDLTRAPGPPYLIDAYTRPHRWLVGLGNDELGYLIPAYDFVLHDRTPYLQQADGDHYEETNAPGPDATDIVLTETARLLGWAP